MEFQVDGLDPVATYKLLVGSVVPRPIAWTVTRSASGTANVAPFSFFTVASRQPPTLAISVGESRRDREPVKDTLRNIEQAPELTVNIASDDLIDAVNTSGSELPGHISEFELAGITPEPSRLVAPPRIREAPVSMECRITDRIEVGADTLLLARVLLWRVHDDVEDHGRIDPSRLRPLGRMAGPTYATEYHIVTAMIPSPEDLLADGAGRSAASTRTRTEGEASP